MIYALGQRPSSGTHPRHGATLGAMSDEKKDDPVDPEVIEDKGEDGEERRPPSPSEPIVIEIDRQIEKLDQVLEKVRGEVTYWAKKGVYTKVRFKFRGKPLNLKRTFV